MLSLAALGTAAVGAVPAAAAPSSVQVIQHVGDVTWYNTGLGACGWWNNDSELVAAVAPEVYGNLPNPNNAPICGKTLRIQGPRGSVEVRVVDKCMSCKKDDVDLSPAAFSKINDVNIGRFRSTWWQL
ncbi:RlpA-like double-psi beta-barrel domain-containing protein [Streptomyces shenzhenensis]